MSRGETGRIAWGLGRVAFLASLEKIREEVNGGWPLSQIYKKHEKSLAGMSYPQFTRHVRKHIRAGHPRTVEKSEKRETVKTKGMTVEPKQFKPSPKVPNPADLF